MRRILLVCCLFLGLGTAVMAQNKTVPAGPAEKAKELQKQLQLTDAQTGKISAIYKESSQKFEKIKA